MNSQRSIADLEAEVKRLRRRVDRLTALLRVLVVVHRTVGVTLRRRRVPQGPDKLVVVRTIEHAHHHVKLDRVLKMIGLSRSRFYSWKKCGHPCELDDRDSCPKTSPHRLTSAELSAIREMATSPVYRHVPTGTLAVLAQRQGRVFASPTTWHRLVAERKWRRPRTRLHPAKPRAGICAESPNELWHIDTTVIRLADGTRCYLYAVIDNFSRRILAWRVTRRFDPGATLEALIAAGSEVNRPPAPTVVVDGGVENMNENVDRLIVDGQLRRVLAMVDVTFSNSMIEAWWRVLKHQWLFLHQLDSVERVRSLVAFYVEQHNTVLPHSAFDGQTPDEMYFSTNISVGERLREERARARADRLATNRAAACAVCEEAMAA